jgi:transcriptional regulator with XRE-family HTH domain
MYPKLDLRTKRMAGKIGKLIRTERESAGISQETLATRIGMTRTNYARVEQGRTNVTIDTLLRIAAGLGLTLSFNFEAPRRRGSG